jgi:hypothetical protein
MRIDVEGLFAVRVCVGESTSGPRGDNAMTPRRLAVVASHPIQNQAPVWRGLAATAGLDVHVYFGSDHSVRGYKDPGFGVEFKWDVPLIDGFPYTFLSTGPNAPDADGFFLWASGLSATWYPSGRTVRSFLLTLPSSGGGTRGVTDFVYRSSFVPRRPIRRCREAPKRTVRRFSLNGSTGGALVSGHRPKLPGPLSRPRHPSGTNRMGSLLC